MRQMLLLPRHSTFSAAASRSFSTDILPPPPPRAPPRAPAAAGGGSAGAAAAAAAAAAPAATWQSLGVPSFLHGRLLKFGAAAPTPIQAACLPRLCASLSRPVPDALLHAETGSGKTLAYLLPVLARLEDKAAPHAGLRAIIVTPTRELAHQVATVAEALGAAGARKDPARALRVAKAVGEVSAQALAALREAPPHVLVGTPTTLSKLVPGHVNLSELQAIVLDEADELLRAHSADAVRALARVARAHGSRPGVLAVSATSSFGLQKFAAEALRRPPARVDADTTGGTMAVPGTLSHAFVRVPRLAARYNTFTRLLAALRPPAVLAFHNSAESMEALEAHLRARGVACGVLGNAYSNAQRNRALSAVRGGAHQVLLSTEMAARGLDIPRLSHVFNFDPPAALREYVHRAGRVGRLSSTTAGRAGTVVTFVDAPAEAEALCEMARELGVAMGELRVEGGVAELTPVVPAAEDIQRHRRRVVEARKVRAVALQEPAPAAPAPPAAPAALAAAAAVAAAAPAAEAAAPVVS
jgi:ATP-dependent RNA helicase DeaD